MDSLSLCRLLLLEWKEIEAIGQLGQYHSGSTLGRKRNNRIREEGEIPQTNDLHTSIAPLHSLTRDRQRVRNCFMGVRLRLLSGLPASFSPVPSSVPSPLCPKSPIRPSVLLASRSIKESYGSPLSIVVRFIPCHVRRLRHQSEQGGRRVDWIKGHKFRVGHT